MGWRTVVVTNTAKLDYKMGYLTIRNSEDTKKIHISEIDTLILESTAVSLTAYLLVELANQKVRVILCDTKKLPNGLYLPFSGCHDSSEKIRTQIKWNDNVKNMVWQSVVVHKIMGQAAILEYFKKEESSKLYSYIPDVEIGDATNREGHAAKVYFNALFGLDFARQDKDNVINAMLNYGYSILLSVISREVVSNGYLTQIGINHDNIFNELNLACDLMEPFRPFVDYKVMQIKDTVKTFETEEKHKLITILDTKIKIDDKEQYLSNAVSIYCKTILDTISGISNNIKFPEYEFTLHESDSDV